MLDFCKRHNHTLAKDLVERMENIPTSIPSSFQEFAIDHDILKR